jgi:hypothetical protein
MGHLLNPCDNSCHASMLKRYWNLLSRKKKPDLQFQIECIHKAYFAEREDSIRSYFKKCGITGTTSPERVLRKLFFEGLYPSRKFLALHESQLNDYFNWRCRGLKSVKDVFGCQFSDLFAQRR